MAAKYIIEFGNRGGAYVENVQTRTRAEAVKMASGLVCVFQNDPHAEGGALFKWDRPKAARLCWQSRTHFVSLSKLDGVPRGPAAAALWRKPHQTETIDFATVYEG